MSVSPRSEKNEKLVEASDSLETVRKSSKYVMTCGTPSPPKSPELSTKNAQNSYTSFSISSILSKQDSNEKSSESKSPDTTSVSSVPLTPSAGFMPHIGGTSALHSCSSDSLMISRYVCTYSSIYHCQLYLAIHTIISINKEKLVASGSR